MPEHTVLGFDFGMKRIGVAVGQTVTQTANPLTILKAVDGVPDWTLVQKIIDEWQADLLVVGVPINMDGSTQEVTFAAKRFANKLHAKFKLPVHAVDERLTSIEAQQHAPKQKHIDAIAAKLIVEIWLRENS